MIETVKNKIENYDPSVVLKDNWKQVKKIVKWAVTALVFSAFGTEEPGAGAISGLVTKIVLDFIDYLISPDKTPND